MSRLANYHGRIPWYFLSFFILVISQPPLLLGLCLPLYSSQFGSNSEKEIDSKYEIAALVICLVGVIISLIS